MTKQKFDWANNLRATATVAVVFVHVVAGVLYRYGKVSPEAWWTANLIDSFARFCVPAFLMLTGALLLPRVHELGDYFRKRLSRVVFPFLFWSCIYIAWKLVSRWHAGESIGVAEAFKFTAARLKGGASFHLWYVYMIIGIYLIIPIFSKWIRHSAKKEISYYLWIWVFAIVISLPGLHILKTEVDLVYFTGYLGYPILGYYLTLTPKSKRARLVGWVFFLFGVAVTAIGTFAITVRSGAFSALLYEFLSPNIVMSSTGIFLIFYNSEVKKPAVTRAANALGKYSYGIYLSHIFMLIMLDKIGISWTLGHPVVGITVTALSCLLLSWLVTALLHKLPFGSYIAG